MSGTRFGVSQIITFRNTSPPAANTDVVDHPTPLSADGMIIAGVRKGHSAFLERLQAEAAQEQIVHQEVRTMDDGTRQRMTFVKGGIGIQEYCEPFMSALAVVHTAQGIGRRMLDQSAKLDAQRAAQQIAASMHERLGAPQRTATTMPDPQSRSQLDTL